jgi:hypothetical protein
MNNFITNDYENNVLLQSVDFVKLLVILCLSCWWLSREELDRKINSSPDEITVNRRIFIIGNEAIIYRLVLHEST